MPVGKIINLADYWQPRHEQRVMTPDGTGTLAGLIPLLEEIARGRIGVVSERWDGMRYYAPDQIQGLVERKER